VSSSSLTDYSLVRSSSVMKMIMKRKDVIRYLKSLLRRIGLHEIGNSTSRVLGLFIVVVFVEVMLAEGRLVFLAKGPFFLALALVVLALVHDLALLGFLHLAALQDGDVLLLLARLMRGERVFIGPLLLVLGVLLLTPHRHRAT